MNPSTSSFRDREIEEPKYPEEKKETPNLVEGKEFESFTKTPELSHQSPLENWETRNGKYGLEYLGIKEIGKEFPLKVQFGFIDNYIKEQLAERGYDATPKGWQDILDGIESQIGSKGLKAYDRIQKIVNYIRILKKLNSTRKLRNAFISGMSESN